MRVTLAVVAATMIASGSVGHAQEPLDGYVIARKACAATVSIRNAESETGPSLSVDRAYRVIGENRVNGSHYYVVVPQAEPARRWIEKSCGDWVKVVARAEAFDRPGGSVSDGGADEPRPGGTDMGGDPASGGSASGGTSEGDTNGPGPVVADGGGSADSDGGAGGSGGGGAHRNLLLAISWQPAFCDTRPNKTECRSQTSERFDADHFSLHGLWPQPRGVEYCSVSAQQKSDDKAGDWDKLPPVEVDAETRAELAKVMPGTQSMLERHEWTKHGTCYKTTADEYYDDSLAVIGAINASKVRDLFAGAIGRSLTRDEIRAAFDESFGAGAGERVRVSCSRDGNRRLIGELTIGLVGEITDEPDVSALIAAARPTDGGCAEGIVDAVGFQ